jgi:hypothetical protein
MASDIVTEKRTTNCDNVFTALDRYDVFYTGGRSDAGVVEGVGVDFYTDMNFASSYRETCSK